MSSIAEWYTGRSILVTGATGFMGKVLIEKILRSIPDIDTIYILVRPKYGVQPNDRVQTMIKLPLFQQLRNTNPQVLQKIIGIEGDVSADDLGIDEENKKLLRSVVSVIFHIAATVKLAAPLKDVIALNLCGTVQMLEFSKEMEKLKVFVHMSTAYCHSDVPTLEEKIYPAPKNPKDIIDILKWMDDEMLASITPGLIKPHPNTYTFAKRLSETVVEEYGKEIPVVVVRPAIVTASMKEPFPGWVDTYNGPVGYMAGIGKGIVKSMVADVKVHAHMIPVDVACNTTIIAAWKRGTRSFPEIPVYNLAQPITWGTFLSHLHSGIKNSPFSWPVFYPTGTIRTNILVHNIIVFFFQLVPAYVIDFMLMIVGKKRYMVELQRKLKQATNVNAYFTQNEFNIVNKNSIDISADLCEQDRKTFYTNTVEIDENYMKHFVSGVRHYCAKEDPKTLPVAKAYLKFLYVRDIIGSKLFLIGILWLLLKLMKIRSKM